MFERFTERARRVIILAREEAGRFRHDFVGTEHILLGLIRDGEGIATAVLQRLGLRLETVKAEVERALAGFPKTLTFGEVPFTPQAKRVLELSIEEARQLGHNYIGTEHLLLGLMQKQVDSQKSDYDKLRDELEKKGQLLSADARREKTEALERKTRDIRRLLDDLEKELQKKEQTMGQKILRDLEGIFTRVGKEKGYAMIIERRQAGVVYGAPEIDVTEDVIKAFDDEMRKAKK